MASRIGECQLPKLLKINRMSQAEFARKMECQPSYITGLIKGTETMSLEFAFNAANVLNCKVEDLYKLIKVSSRRAD